MQKPRFRKKTTTELRNENEARSFPATGRLYLLLHNIRSVHNVGSIFRTADGFGVHELLLTGYTPSPPDPGLSKTALGAEESVVWRAEPDPIPSLRALKADGVRIYALEQTWESTPIHQVNLPQGDLCLILGNEITGVDDTLLRLADDVLEIPQFGVKHSLNVSVAAGIALYAFYEKMQARHTNA